MSLIIRPALRARSSRKAERPGPKARFQRSPTPREWTGRRGLPPANGCPLQDRPGAGVRPRRAGRGGEGGMRMRKLLIAGMTSVMLLVTASAAMAGQVNGSGKSHLGNTIGYNAKSDLTGSFEYNGDPNGAQ